MKTTLKIRKAYDASVPTRLSFPNATRTKKSFQAECDINSIMRKYQQTGLLTHTRNIQGTYGDFTGVPDYQDCLNRVISAQLAFDALPSSLRKRFNNDPAELLAFVSDGKNRDEAIKLGLIETPDISTEGKKSKPGEPLKPVPPKGEKPPAKAKPDAGETPPSDE